MILAGDIGGTNARLAYFQSQNGHLSLATEGVFPSREHRGLDEIVSKFVEGQSVRPDIACFGVAGPVRNGKVETSNLPWTVDASRLAGELQLPNAMLINDLEANPQPGRKRSRIAESGEGHARGEPGRHLSRYRLG
jgi:glucokinase